MARGHFRHVIVLDQAGQAVGILSMRDIVRCWVSDGASCDVPDEQAEESTPEPEGSAHV